MIFPKITGDASLFDEIGQIDIGMDEASIVHGITISQLWDVYGLPDGSRNPTSGKDVHLLGPPPVQDINNAFNNVLSRILKPNEFWLMDIPRQIAWLRSLDASVFCTNDNRAAIVLPYGAFGGLFIANELFMACQLGPSYSISADKLEKIKKDFPKLLAFWILGMGENSEGVMGPIADLVLFRQLMRRDEKAGFVSWHLIWAMTVVQQIFMLLHEFGHLFQVAESPKSSVNNNLYRFNFTGVDREIDADKFACLHMNKGFTVYEGGDKGKTIGTFQQPDFLKLSLFNLFGFIYILRQYNYLAIDQDDFLKRWLSLAKIMDPELGLDLTLDDARNVFERIEDYLLTPSKYIDKMGLQHIYTTSMFKYFEFVRSSRPENFAKNFWNMVSRSQDW